MNFIRNITSSVSEVYNSINPATLTGAIDVIVVEQEDGSLACSPFHVRFGKYQILRPSQKKVLFKVNDTPQEFSMKLGEGGEAFFVFETSEDIPAAMQTSPLVSPITSPDILPAEPPRISLQEPDPLDLTLVKSRSDLTDSSIAGDDRATKSEVGDTTPGAVTPTPKPLPSRPTSMFVSSSSVPQLPSERPPVPRPIETLLAERESLAQKFERASSQPVETHNSIEEAEDSRSSSPPPISKSEAVTRAINLSKKLWSENIPTHITETGDLMLDMTGYKPEKITEGEAIQVEIMARKLLSEEMEGNYDIGALIGIDDQGNIWIYSSEEAKMAADRKASMLSALNPSAMRSVDVVSDPGYHSDDTSATEIDLEKGPTHHFRRDSDSAVGLGSPPDSPHQTQSRTAGDPNLNYAKTLRLSSDQLKALNLKHGLNTMHFQVNKATAQAYIYFWRHDVPIVISDIDGTITKSDAMGHMMNAIGRDWTHQGVTKLYTDIASNGYNLMYLTSRSVGQADSTRNYLNGIVQDGYKIPRGPVILSPDRTIAALRREVIMRKPEVFKMACLRDIMNLFQHADPQAKLKTPFYAGFGNRLNDAMSYRSVSIPATRIFTINSNAEVSLYLTTLSTYRTSYVSMREIVDHYFPPVGTLVKDGGEEYTDFNYWRDRTLEMDEFSASESDEEEDDRYLSNEEEDEEDDDMPEYGESSYYSARRNRQRRSMNDSSILEGSVIESIEGGDGGSYLGDSQMLSEHGGYDDAASVLMDDLTLMTTQSRQEAASASDVKFRELEMQAQSIDEMYMAGSADPSAEMLSEADLQDNVRELGKAMASPKADRRSQ